MSMKANEEKGTRVLPKFGEWDVNNPASADGFTVIFSKARDEKKTGQASQNIDNNNNNDKATGLKQDQSFVAGKRFCCF